MRTTFGSNIATKVNLWKDGKLSGQSSCSPMQVAIDTGDIFVLLDLGSVCKEVSLPTPSHQNVIFERNSLLAGDFRQHFWLCRKDSLSFNLSVNGVRKMRFEAQYSSHRLLSITHSMFLHKVYMNMFHIVVFKIIMHRM